MIDGSVPAPSVPDRIVLRRRRMGSFWVYDSKEIPGLSAGGEDEGTSLRQALDVAGVLVSIASVGRVRYRLSGPASIDPDGCARFDAVRIGGP